MAGDSSNPATITTTASTSTTPPAAAGGITHHPNPNTPNQQHPPSPFHSPNTNRTVLSTSAMTAGAAGAAATSSFPSSSPRPTTHPNASISMPPPATVVSPSIGGGSYNHGGIVNGRERSRSFGHAHLSPGTPGGRRSLPTSPLLRRLHANPHAAAGGLMPPPFMPNMSSSTSTTTTTIIPPPSSPPTLLNPTTTATTEIDHALSLEHRKQTAIKHALEQERNRTSRLELLEQDMSISDLQKALKRERQHSARLASDLAALKVENVQGQAEAEMNEEGRINGLMRRLECLQKEKGRIIVELEREEEMLTNTLQKKLNEVRREKMLLERQIEQEHLEHAQLLRSNNIGGGIGVAAAPAEGGSNCHINNSITGADGVLRQRQQQQQQSQSANSLQQHHHHSQQQPGSHGLPTIEIKEDEEQEENEGSDCGEQIILEDLAGIQQDNDDDDEHMGM